MITRTTTHSLGGFDDIRETLKHRAVNKQPDIKKNRLNKLQRDYREGEMTQIILAHQTSILLFHLFAAHSLAVVAGMALTIWQVASTRRADTNVLTITFEVNNG